MNIFKKKWKRLKDEFFKEHERKTKKLMNTKIQFQKKFVYYNHLLFLLPHSTTKPTTSCLNFSQKFDQNINSREGNRFTASHPSQPEQKAQTTFYKTYMEDNLVQKNFDKIKDTDDPDRLFLLSLIEYLKQVPDSLKKLVKLNVVHSISCGLQAQRSLLDLVNLNFDHYVRQLDQHLVVPMLLFLPHSHAALQMPFVERQLGSNQQTNTFRAFTEQQFSSNLKFAKFFPCTSVNQSQITMEDNLEKINFSNEKMSDNTDRLFLLSLIEHLKQVPDGIKMQVKLNVIRSIYFGLQVQRPILNFMSIYFDHYYRRQTLINDSTPYSSQLNYGLQIPTTGQQLGSHQPMDTFMPHIRFANS